MALSNGNDIALKVGFDIDRFTSELSKTNGMLNTWGNQMKSIVTNAFGFYAVQRFATEVVTSLAQFEKSMSEVKAITGAAGKEFDALRDNALNLAGAFKAIDISKLETEFGRLGFSTQEILDSTAATINLASATGSDLANSAVIAGSTLRAFNLDAKEMGRVTDVMAGALNRTGLDMSSFAEAIKYVAPNAYAANISLEETSALLGVLADNGIKGSMAGTTLRRIIQDLAKDGRPLSERLAELAARGLSTSDAMEEVGRIGSTGLLILTKNVDKVGNLADALHNVTGEAKAMSDVMQNNLIGDWNKLGAEFDKTMNSQDGNLSAIRMLTQYYTGLLKVLNGTSDAYKIFNSENEKHTLLQGVHDKNVIASGGGDNESEGFRATRTGNGTGKTMPGPNLGWFANAMIQTGATKDLDDWAKSVMAAAGNLDILKGATDGAAEGFGEFDHSLDDLTETSENLGLTVPKNLIKVAITAEQLSRQLRNTFVSLASGIGSTIGNMMSGIKGSFESGLLQTLGNVAVQVGKMAVEIGLAMLGIKEALMLGDPFTAIAAGVALIALGTYFSNQSASIAGSSNGGGGSGGGGGIRLSPQNVNVTGEFRVRGSDLVLALDKQNYNTSVGTG